MWITPIAICSCWLYKHQNSKTIEYIMNAHSIFSFESLYAVAFLICFLNHKVHKDI